MIVSDLSITFFSIIFESSFMSEFLKFEAEEKFLICVNVEFITKKIKKIIKYLLILKYKKK